MKNCNLLRLVIGGLVAIGVISVVGIIWLTASGKEVPQSLEISSIVTALSLILSRSDRGIEEPKDKE